MISGNRMTSVIEAGSKEKPNLLMLHGGPGYYWVSDEIQNLATKIPFHVLALQGRGCGIGDNISYNHDLTDDNLYKRASDLQNFKNPDVLLGHSTGAMVALTAVMEGFINPKQILLLSPYTASLGEHDYWINRKAGKYPCAFARFHGFVEAKWREHHGSTPLDMKENLYIYWGRLFPLLPTDTEKIRANLHYLDFHVIDSVPHIGIKDGEPYTQYALMLKDVESLSAATKEALLRIGTINAHWWQTNFQDGYPLLEKVKNFSFSQPIHILSGEHDEITPPETVRKLAKILKTKPVIAPNSHHLPETAMPGKLLDNLIRLLNQI